MSARDTAIGGLASVLATELSPIEVTRDETRSRNPPAAGLVLIREGQMLSALPIMSPLQYAVEWSAELLVLVPQSTDVPAARATLDGLLSDIDTAIATDRSLAGACDWAQPGEPQFVAQEDEGTGALLAALLPVTLSFTAPNSPAG